VESEEAMTVSFARIPDAILNMIVKEIRALSAVDYIFYDITNKPPGTIEWE
jgi:GMP synthase (glutamine-hydrolysing)